jgi:hypothetical protein
VFANRNAIIKRRKESRVSILIGAASLALQRKENIFAR